MKKLIKLTCSEIRSISEIQKIRGFSGFQTSEEDLK